MEVSPGFKNTDVGVIPKEWEVSTLRELTSLLTNGFVGTVTNHYVNSDDGIMYIQGFNVQENGYNLTGIKRVSKQFHQRNMKSCLVAGDLLTIQTGDIGVTTLVPVEFEGSNCHALVITRLKRNAAEPSFYCQLLNSAFGRRILKGIETGSTMKHLNITAMQYLSLPKPPLPEQRAIAEALSDVDALIAALDKLIAKKRDIKQATMQELLTGKTHLPGFSGVWEVKRLGEITSRYTNGGTPSTLVPEYWTGHIPWITGADVVGQRVANIRRFITHDAVASSSTNVVDKGDLLVVSRTGVGKLAVAPFDIAISQDLTGVKLVKELALTAFVFMYFDHKRFLLTNLNQGTSIAGITRDVLADVAISLPSLDEQSAIASFISDMDAEITALEERRDKTYMLKQGMMQELLTGRIRLV